MVSLTRSILSYFLPIVFCFLMVGIISPSLFAFPAYYLSLLMYLISVFVMINFFKLIEKGKIKNIGEFFGVMILFIFFIILMFSGIYHYYATPDSYLVDLKGEPRSDQISSFYFSGVTFLAIGYGDILPAGAFIIISILEGILGSVVIFSFIAIGAASIYEMERKRFNN